MKLVISGDAEAQADIEELKGAFDFTKQELGARTCHVAARTIKELMDEQVDPNGWPWAELSEEYAREKAQIAPGAPIGVLYGHMKQMDQLEGEQQITPRCVEHEYGIDEQAKTEALKFQLGGLVTGTTQPQRPFWGIGFRLKMALDEFFDAEWKRK